MFAIKVVYNNRYVGFSLSKEGSDLYNQNVTGSNLSTVNNLFLPKRNNCFSQVVEELGIEHIHSE